MSSVIFNVFVNVFILHLKTLNVGCHVSGMFLRCLLYADEIILISPSVIGLQEMLDKCHEISDRPILSLYSLMFVNVTVWLLGKNF